MSLQKKKNKGEISVRFEAEERISFGRFHTFGFPAENLIKFHLFVARVGSKIPSSVIG
jgi:hypothetical protein